MGQVGADVLQWAAVARPHAPGAQLGDACLVRPIACGALVAVVDGIGRGAEAATAAARVLREIDRHAEQPLDAMCRRSHAALHEARGAVLALAALDVGRDTVTWLGVGSVHGVLHRAGLKGRAQRIERLVPRRGALGRVLPPLSPLTLAVARDDLLVLATDGIDPGFEDTIKPVDASVPESIARRILITHARSDDDALVLVARYRGGGS